MNEVLTFDNLHATQHYHTEDLIVQFQEDCIGRGFTFESTRHYVSQVRVFMHYLDERHTDLTLLDKDTLIDFVGYLRTEHGKKQGVSLKTLKNYLTCINTFLSFLYLRERLSADVLMRFQQVRKWYARSYKSDDPITVRKLLTVPELRMLAFSILNPRDRALVVLFAKTGIRRNELISIDVEDVDLQRLTIMLKPQHKRTNCQVFFDHETAKVLEIWISTRAQLGYPSKGPLFISQKGGRLGRQGVYLMIRKYAQQVGLDNPHSPRTDDHLTPHCFRHWFTTHLNRAGMSRSYIAWLRGDRMNRDAQDTYIHIDPEDVLRVYLDTIPKLEL